MAKKMPPLGPDMFIPNRPSSPLGPQMRYNANSYYMKSISKKPKLPSVRKLKNMSSKGK